MGLALAVDPLGFAVCRPADVYESTGSLLTFTARRVDGARWSPGRVRPLRDKLLGGGRGALAGKEERGGERELRRRVGELERALGRETYVLEMAGEASRGRLAHPERCK
jgi:hypothetical protein